MVPARIQANGQEVTTHALLDTGSDVTLCTRSVIKSLKLNGTPARYSINTINKKNTVSNGVEVALSVLSLDRAEAIHIPKVWGVDVIPVNTRNMDKEGNVCCSFIMGKSRLAPIKTISIPRLELTAASLAVKQNGLLQRELDMEINATHYWSDSKTVLKYINNKSKRFHIFVSNRIAMIHRGSDVSEWKYVPTTLNPADDATRGMKVKEFSPSCCWLGGPPFLMRSESLWPSKVIDSTIDEGDAEVKGTVLSVAYSSNTIDQLLERYSEWDRLLRFKQFIIQHRSIQGIDKGPIGCDEIGKAEIALIAYAQRESYPHLFAKDTKNMPKALRKLAPYICDGLYRVGGRLEHSPVNFDLKHPISVPSGHFASLIIREYHQVNGHVGPSHTWTLIRQRYWILRGGAKVRKVLGKCLRCQRMKSRPCTKVMSELPSVRVTPDAPPFDITGVDYFGPLIIKQGRSTPKRYCCLFTCLNSRAIHLELAAD